MENKTKKVEIEIPVGKTAKWVDGVLTLVDEKPQDVTERIKTFEDACCELGDEHQFVKEYRILAAGNRISADLYAYFKLRIITAALNEGWEPQFTLNEERWYVFYGLVNKEQYDRISKEGERYAIYRDIINTDDYYGLIYGYTSNCTFSLMSGCGSHIALKNKKLAEYAGRQFAEIYADFCFRPKSEENKG